MKKISLFLALMLLLSLPLMSLASETTNPPAEESQTTTPPAEQTPTTNPAPRGLQRGRRWNQQPEAPQRQFTDENGDGICDTCGMEPGTNKDAPNFVDENQDGVCDHLGTQKQGQGKGRNQALRGQGRNKRDFGRSQGRGMNQEGPNFVDANKDGVCDNMTSQDAPARQGRQPQGGRGRNRR